MRLRWLAVAAFVVAAFALVVIAPPAGADTAEEQFLKSVSRQGGLPGTPAVWVEEGNKVCSDLANNAAMGVSPQKAGFDQIQTAGERGWKPKEAVIIIAAAMTYLCPQPHY